MKNKRIPYVDGIKLAKSRQISKILQNLAYTFVYVNFFLYLCAQICCAHMYVYVHERNNRRD